MGKIRENDFSFLLLARITEITDSITKNLLLNEIGLLCLCYRHSDVYITMQAPLNGRMCSLMWYAFSFQLSFNLYFSHPFF